MAIDLGAVDGLRVRRDGRVVLRGPLLSLERRLDAMFRSWAARWGATEIRFPEAIDAADLDRVGFFQAFPHLATVPAALHPNDLSDFAQAPLCCDGSLRLHRIAAAREVLTPAACYPVYLDLENERLEAARFITTRNTCYRKEIEIQPLRRQRAFSMREIVCVGNADEVEHFVIETRGWIDAFFERIGLPIRWAHATDPFFDPRQSPKYLFQRAIPVKYEIVFGGNLAIGSTNHHRGAFGHAFGITRDGEAAHSACIAFGLERWLYAFLARFGPQASQWPAVEVGDG